MSHILYVDATTDRLMLGISDADHMLVRCTVSEESHRRHAGLSDPVRAIHAEGSRDRRFRLERAGRQSGAGSFYWIRTGIITVRTIAQFLHVPVYGINTFEIFAAGSLRDTARDTAIFLDALRLRAWSAVLRHTESGPVYRQPPGLTMLHLEHNTAPEDAQLLIAPSLAALFPDQDAMPIEPVFTPDAMLSLIRQYGSLFQRPWEDIHPLYLQDPVLRLLPALLQRADTRSRT